MLACDIEGEASEPDPKERGAEEPGVGRNAFDVVAEQVAQSYVSTGPQKRTPRALDARFLQKITEAYRRNPGLVNLMLDPYFKRALAAGQESWREVVALAVRHGIPVPAFGSALS